ncbi:UNVERIFIED_CONTAM: hypothetical protein PYX00_011264 [Menopon gallinae]|uniref:Proteasome subunit beta n=1 Tax=Menopon gallinae TaxID=328185 RepID=A0AAW2H770_9NEOP
MAVRCGGGVVLGADTRTSLGTYIPSNMTDKLKRLSETIYCCVSGSAADTQMITRHVVDALKSLEVIEGEAPTVRRAAVMARNIVYNNRWLLAKLIIAGYDSTGRGSIFSVDLGGTVIESEWALGGSGSAFIYGYCDANWRQDMTLEDGLQFVRSAIGHATKRDNMSGGCIRMAAIGEGGVARYFVPGDRIVAG